MLITSHAGMHLLITNMMIKAIMNNNHNHNNHNKKTRWAMLASHNEMYIACMHVRYTLAVLRQTFRVVCYGGNFC